MTGLLQERAETGVSEIAPNGRHQPSLYEVLQVSPLAEPDVIRAAYRVLARSYHPDLSHAQNAAGLMRRLNAAYDVLSDPQRRARYDARCYRSVRSPGGKRGTAGSRRGSRAPVRLASLPVDRRTASPSMRAMAALVIMILAAVLAFALWIAYDALDDQAPRAFQPPGRPPEIALFAQWRPELDLLAADRTRHLLRPCESSRPSPVTSCLRGSTHL